MIRRVLPSYEMFELTSEFELSLSSTVAAETVAGSIDSLISAESVANRLTSDAPAGGEVVTIVGAAVST